MIKIEINGEVLTVKFDDKQLDTLTKTFEAMIAKEIRRRVREVLKEEAEK